MVAGWVSGTKHLAVELELEGVARPGREMRPVCTDSGKLSANSQCTSGQAREEDAASVRGYTGTL
jgi:hypothetical protein